MLTNCFCFQIILISYLNKHTHKSENGIKGTKMGPVGVEPTPPTMPILHTNRWDNAPFVKENAPKHT